MSAALLIEQLLNGLITGSMYALVAAGLALIYGTLRILNFAHGEFFMLGGFGLVSALSLAWSPWLAVPAAGVAVAVVGLLIYRSVLEPLARQGGNAFPTIAATLGLSIFLQNFALRVFGEQYLSAPYFVDGMFEFAGIRLPAQRLLIVAAACVALGLAWALLRCTRFGRAVRATALDAEAAQVCGVPVGRVRAATFALGTLMAGVAGAMLAPIYAVNPWMGVPVLLKAFVVVVMGGLGSFSGAVIAGLLLGVVEAVGVSLTSSEWRDLIAYVVLLVVVWFRPWGLFGVAER